MLDILGYGKQKFVGLQDTYWSFDDGPIAEKIEDCDSVGKIFDLLWSQMSEKILASTLSRGDLNLSLEDLNLFLASFLVIGITPQPEISSYFMQDPRGIFGSKWMQERFSRDKWHYYHAHLHLDPFDLSKTLQQNSAQIYSPTQVVVVDEMIVPFEGRWKYIQHVRGKLHNTGFNCNHVNFLFNYERN